MIGIIADLPVREAPVIILTTPLLNDKIRGEYSCFRGHKMIEFMANFILKPHFQPFPISRSVSSEHHPPSFSAAVIIFLQSPWGHIFE